MFLIGDSFKKKNATLDNWEKNSIKTWDQSPFPWTFAGFNQEGEFREKAYDEPSSQLTQILGMYLEDSDVKMNENLPTKTLMTTTIAQLLNFPELHVIAVMVPGGPYAEDAERRLRDRYAVISGLANSGYVAEDPEHIGYIELTEKCKVAIKENDTDSTQFCDWPAFIPYEWFAPIKPIKNNSSIIHAPRRVLVLWLANESFFNPLNMLGQLRHLITPRIGEKKFGKENYIDVKFDVLGPSDSGTLERMYAEIFKAQSLKDDAIKFYSNLEDSTIFSSQATKSADTIIQQMGADKEDSNVSKLSNTIQRMTSTNNELASELVCELTRRGIQPFGKIDVYKREQVTKHCKDAVFLPRLWPNQLPHHIALISEFDTVYSRDLTQAFTKQIKDIGDRNLSENTTVENKEKRIHYFNYLRGLDGIDANEKHQTENTKKLESDQKDLENKVEQIRRPVGTNQFDYLRRIAERINQLNDKLIKENTGQIKAIGILGSDPYDKLLILQILRKQFPNMVFFTTDLDARLLHPAEIKWTRNVIVASSYDLKLSDDLQKGAPPFRDSYQTGLYLSTLMAIGCWQEDCQDIAILNNRKSFHIDEHKPQMFEIGHNGAVQLSANNSQGSDHFTLIETISFLVFPFVLAAFVYFQSSEELAKLGN